MGKEPQTQTTIETETEVGTFYDTEPEEFAPIRIKWWGYARARIAEINVDDDPKANKVRATLRRSDKRVVIIESPEEAAALAGELDHYIGDFGWSWVDTTRSESMERVRDTIIDEMAKRGYKPTYHTSFSWLRDFEYVGAEAIPEPEPDPEPDLPPEPGSRAWRRARREEADLDALLELCKEHARQVCADVWPGGTVDPDVLDWEWNTRLRSCAGYYWNAHYHVPDYSKCDRPNCSNYHEGKIELAPGSYYTHGLAELLSTVRHELIHAWQDYHPDADNNQVHGPQFKQWLDDMDTGRYCKHWSK